jgi:hypothetical protein
MIFSHRILLFIMNNVDKVIFINKFIFIYLFIHLLTYLGLGTTLYDLEGEGNIGNERLYRVLYLNNDLDKI